MRRAIFLLAVVVILIVASLTIGFGWHLYVTEKITQIIKGQPDKIEQASVPQAIEVKETSQPMDVRLKLGERAGYKRNGYAVVNVTITNMDNFTGNAKLEATLYYSREPVASSTVSVENISPNQKSIKTIRINTTKSWNAFEVKQV